MKKEIILVFLFLFLTGVVMAEESFTFKQFQDVDLKIPVFDENNDVATASIDCYLSVRDPKQNLLINDQTMSFNAGGLFSYSINKENLTELGSYPCSMRCTDGAVSGFSTFTFDITPSGQSGSSNIVFYVFIILLLYGINLFGFFGKNEIMTILGGMALIFLGLYMVNYGVIIYRDTLTNYLAYVTIAWGAISSIWATLSLMDVL